MTRECQECDLCCRRLLCVINDHVVHPGKPCFYLGNHCTIYEQRPQLCRDYLCAYMQNIVPEWMKPSLSKVIVSVEPWGPNKEFKLLRATECGQKLSVEVLSWLVDYSRDNNIGLIYQLENVWHYLGPDAFMEFFAKLRLTKENNDTT